MYKNSVMCQVSCKKSKNALKILNMQLSTKFKAYDYWFRFYPFQHNNLYQIVLCAKFHGKQTKIELLYARMCQKRLNELKNAN